MKTREVPTTKTGYSCCETCGKWYAWDQDARNCEWKHADEAKKAACTHPEPHYYSIYLEDREEGCGYFEVSSRCLDCQKVFGNFKIHEGSDPKAEVVYRALKANEGEM